MKKLFFAGIMLVSYCSALCQTTWKYKSKKVIIQGKVPANYEKEDISLTSFPTFTQRIGYTSDETQVIPKKNVNGFAKWEYSVDYPIDVFGDLFSNPYFHVATLEPGDSVNVEYKGNDLVFSGNGSKKLELLYRIGKMSDSIQQDPAYRRMSHPSGKTMSLNDYLLWNEFLNKKERLILPVIETYKPFLSEFAFNNIKERFLYKAEEVRTGKFLKLRGTIQREWNISRERVNQFGLTEADMLAIYDSTQNGPGAKWLEKESPLVNDPYYLLKRLIAEGYRQGGQFIKVNDTDTSVLGEGVNFWKKMYEMGKQRYSGNLRDALLSFTLWYARGSIYYYGFAPEVEEMMADFYANSPDSRYKEYTHEYELKRRESYNAKNASAFSLTDGQGKTLSNQNLKGKITLMDFWFTGCTGCVQMIPALRKVEERFKNDTNVVFLSISTDRNKEQWQASIKKGKYTTGSGINLYTDGQGTKHDMIRNYGIEGYPTLVMIDPYNRQVRQFPFPDPRKDEGKALISLIEKQLVMMKDGPYVFHNGKSITAYSIDGGSLIANPVDKEGRLTMRVQTDKLGKQFSFPLQPWLNVAPAEYARPEKLLVLSDVEGNFDAFRKLLQVNKVIDENFNWTFGNNHLVLAGDMFDRGMQVTECLWLVYSLEEKAKQAGGVVHFILGNHEHMNLIGNHKYVQEKYETNAALMGKSITELYGENTELGRWLRTKNIMEKIGDLLFTHGGVSRKLNETNVSVAEINSLMRPHFDSAQKDYGDERVNAILSDRVGPMWYRGYYESGVPMPVLDSTLQKFAVKHIITGHTIIADTISTHYENKVINTDTKHAVGKSEALLIEGKKFYRVNQEGEKRLLFSDEPRRAF